jgi:hypothetical protein
MTGEAMNKTLGARAALDGAAREAQQILDEEWAR